MWIAIALMLGFLFGIVFEKYIIPVSDMKLQVFASSKRLDITKISQQIEEVENFKAMEGMETAEVLATYEKRIWEIKKDMREDDTHAIGFRYEDGDIAECDCEEVEEDCDDDCDCDDCNGECGCDDDCECGRGECHPEDCKTCKPKMFMSKSSNSKTIGFKSNNIKC